LLVDAVGTATDEVDAVDAIGPRILEENTEKKGKKKAKRLAPGKI